MIVRSAILLIFAITCSCGNTFKLQKKIPKEYVKYTFDENWTLYFDVTRIQDYYLHVATTKPQCDTLRLKMMFSDALRNNSLIPELILDPIDSTITLNLQQHFSSWAAHNDALTIVNVNRRTKTFLKSKKFENRFDMVRGSPKRLVRLGGERLFFIYE